jgi:predicted Fe-S protein YdhL (DUF1289 family)
MAATNTGMSTPKAVSDYMRDMQARSAKSRWAGMNAAEKSAAMKALRAKGKRKPKRVARRSNVQGEAQRPDGGASNANKNP